MAKWIKTTGATLEVAPKGEIFTLEELQGFVGGFIEAVPLSDGTVMWLNEEGKLNGLPVNVKADGIAHRMSGIALWDRVVGDVLIASLEETEEDEEEEE